MDGCTCETKISCMFISLDICCCPLRYLFHYFESFICILMMLCDNGCSWIDSIIVIMFHLYLLSFLPSPFTLRLFYELNEKYEIIYMCVYFCFCGGGIMLIAQGHMISSFFTFHVVSVRHCNMSFWCTLFVCRFTTGLAITLLVWPTVTEQLHLTRNVHHNVETACPTAKTGLLGGGAFLSLDSSLFWLVALMLAGNAREDYFDEIADKGANSESLKSSAWNLSIKWNNNLVSFYFEFLLVINYYVEINVWIWYSSLYSYCWTFLVVC